MRAGELGDVTQTAAYRTARGEAIKPGDPGGSEVVKRMSSRSRFPPSMPPLASERIDEQGAGGGSGMDPRAALTAPSPAARLGALLVVALARRGARRCRRSPRPGACG